MDKVEEAENNFWRRLIQKRTREFKRKKAIPSNFQVILTVCKRHLGTGPGHKALKLTDALMEALPRPPGTCLCACNRAWIPLVRGKPQDAEGHGWDDCSAGRES